MIYAAGQAGLRQLPDTPRRRAAQATMGASAALLAEAQAGELDVVIFTDARAEWPEQHMRATTRPTVVLCSGLQIPGEWLLTRGLRGWCKSAYVLAEGGAPSHYKMASETAKLVGRVALIECHAHLGDAWAHALGCPNTTIVKLQPAASRRGHA